MEKLCVIFNPAAGRRRARRRWDRLSRKWGAGLEIMPSEHPGHAEELARNAARAGFTVVAAAGGDGTVHEVANGILRAARPEVRFAIIPLGSANDYAHSVDWEFSHPARNGQGHAYPRAELNQVRAVDVGVIRTAGRERSFVCCLGLGLNGAVNREARRVRCLQGVALYGLATLRALWYDYGCPRLELILDEEPAWSTPTLLFSTLLGRREGGFMLAPRARLADGWFDYVHAGDLSRWEVVKLLPRVALTGPPGHYPKVRQGRCRRARVRAETPLTIHLDGEPFCRPANQVRDIEISICPRALLVTRLEEFSNYSERR
jgi:diacylglycerol kinase family enzyme